jgi:ribosomal protein S18 acetylase RimI-like enzyme
MGPSAEAASRIVVDRLDEKDLPEAARIFRLAFGTFLGAPDPETFWRDRDYVHGRHQAAHVASFGAKLEGKLVGSNFATKWGSVGFFGPLTVHPDLQERGIGRALLAGTMPQFDAWGTRQVGLFTFAHSAKHVALYQKFGFYARFLTAIMSAPVAPRGGASRFSELSEAPHGRAGESRFSQLSETQRREALRSCRDLTDELYAGLDLTAEIGATQAQGLGDTVLIDGAHGIAAFAVCHHGPRSEAGAERCLIKFGAVRAGPLAEQDYLRLLDACGAYAAAVGMPNLSAGANMARHEAYRHLVARGFRAEIQGVSMHRHNDPGYCRPGIYIIDDWR